MNKWIGMGRLCADPEISTSQGGTLIARYRLAIDRRFKKDGEQSADFLPCVAFGKAAEFAEKYLHKGTKMVVEGRIETGSYDHKDGYKVYTTTVVVESQEFAESKNAAGEAGANVQSDGANNSTSDDGFVNIPDDIDEELPFV